MQFPRKTLGPAPHGSWTNVKSNSTFVSLILCKVNVSELAESYMDTSAGRSWPGQPGGRDKCTALRWITNHLWEMPGFCRILRHDRHSGTLFKCNKLVL